MRDYQSKAYQLTINNPDKNGYTYEIIFKILSISKASYACLGREIGENGTEHIHIYIMFPTPRRWSTIKKRFPKAHIEKAFGTPQDNREYICKEGKWKDTIKSETKVKGSFAEYGKFPSEYELRNPDMYMILSDIENGASDSEIIEKYPKYIFKVNAIDSIRQALFSDRYSTHMRNVCVTYISGYSGTGKTKSIYSRYPISDIYRITSYKTGVKFDSYQAHDVIVFEEFASQIQIGEMLNYLDIYPIMLPARYNEKVACYTKVIITSNLPLEKQYIQEQISKPLTYKAFLRRINYVETYDENGNVTRKKLNDEVKYMNSQGKKLNENFLINVFFIYVAYGIKRTLKSKISICFLSVLIVAITVFNTIYVFMSNINAIFTLIKIFWRIIIVAFVFLSVLFFIGKPKCSISYMHNFSRIGMTNSVGETPLLIYQKEIHSIKILKFRNCGIPLSVWNDKKENIESGLNLNIENISEYGKRYIVIKAVSGNSLLKEKINWNRSMLTKENFVLKLGESYTGTVEVNLRVTPHILIGGSTGSGKSVLLKLLLMQCVLKNGRVYIADFKGGVDFPGTWHVKCNIITERAELICTLDKIVAELHSRKRKFVALGCANIDEYNRANDADMNRIIFACDELAELLDKTGLDKKVKEEISKIEAYIATIARLGRAFGIHLILATQRPDANIISGQIKNNIDYRVCGRADDVLSQIILDKTDASDFIDKEKQGRFLNNSDVLFQGYYFDDKNNW